jgi:hypothetical protein
MKTIPAGVYERDYRDCMSSSEIFASQPSLLPSSVPGSLSAYAEA